MIPYAIRYVKVAVRRKDRGRSGSVTSSVGFGGPDPQRESELSVATNNLTLEEIDGNVFRMSKDQVLLAVSVVLTDVRVWPSLGRNSTLIFCFCWFVGWLVGYSTLRPPVPEVCSTMSSILASSAYSCQTP